MAENENHSHSESTTASLRVANARFARMTSQRAAVVEAARAFGRAFTVDDLVAHVRTQTPGIGVATVYRTVASLVDAGVLTKVGERSGSARYVLCTKAEHHHHLICTVCEHVLCTECDLETIVTATAARNGFAIDEHELTLWGICTTCMPPYRGRKEMRER